MTTQPSNIGQYKRECNDYYVTGNKKKSNKTSHIRRGGRRR